MTDQPLYQQLPDTTRVWIYQSNQPFPEAEIPAIRKLVRNFAQQWVSHNRQLRAYGDILHQRFVVLMVDESQADASGCSIDASVAFLKQLQAHYRIDLFDRMRFSFLDGDRVQTLSREEFAALYQKGDIHDETPVFDTLVKTKGDFEHAFVKPLKESWHIRMV